MPSAKELREMARDSKVPGYSKMNKAQLVESLEKLGIELNAPVEKETTPVEKETAPVTEAAAKKERKPSAWVQHCRDYAKEHGCSYKQAMSAGKEEYAAKKAKAKDDAASVESA